MKISFFNNIKDTNPQTEDMTWEEVKETFSEHDVVGDKFDAMLFNPVEYNGEGIQAANVYKVHCCVLDLDDITEEKHKEVLEVAKDYEYIMYTTYKHSKAYADNGSWRSRIIIPFSEPVANQSWNKVWRRIDALFLNASDPKCKDSGRRYFVPSAPTEEGNVIKINEGKVLDISEIRKLPEPKVIVESKEAITASQIKEFARKLKIRKSIHHKEIGDAISKGLNGHAMAESGHRDHTYFKISASLAQEYPNVDPYLIASFFSASMAQATAEGSKKSTIDNLTSKLKRSQEEAKEVIAQKQEDEATEQTMLIKDAFAPEDRTHPYTEEELNKFANDYDVNRERFKTRWLLYLKNSYFLFKKGTYMPPCGKDDLAGRVKIDLSPACTADVTRFKAVGKGPLKPKTNNELLEDYGTSILRVISSLSARKSVYDQNTRTLTEALCPVRDIKPKRDPEIERWLSLLGGEDEERLLDWVAAVTLLDRPCAALYLAGEPGAGKGLFAKGLTRLWKAGDPTPLKHAAGTNFNDALSRCPLVFCDEDLPEHFKKTGNTGELREFIQSTDSVLSRKFVDTTELQGAIRLILAANNDDLLKTNENLTVQDTEAIAERICHIKVGKEPVQYLKDLGGLEYTRRWVDGDGLAAHALWLRENRKLNFNNRFILDGKHTDFHRRLAVGTGLADSVSHWLVSYLQDPDKMDFNRTGLILIKDKQLHVSAKAFTDHWDVYKTNSKSPKANSAAKALARLCTDSRVAIRVNGKKMQYRIIDTENLVAWGQFNNFITEEEIKEALLQDTIFSGQDNESFTSLVK